MNESKKRLADGEETGLFAAANSGRGFVSFYGEIFDRPAISRRYLIKGGPGTGKSSLMRKIAAAARERGHSVRTYRCSSDPESLDGVIVDGRIAVLDGTAPHAVEPTLAGARDEIVNLGAFWDPEALAARYGEIEALHRKKEGAYRRAYRYLSAATELAAVERELTAPYLLEKKMRDAVARLLRSAPLGKGFELLPELQSAISMRGQVRLNTYEQMAKRLYAIEDFFGIGSVFLSYLIEEAERKRQPISVSYAPLMPDRPDGVLFRETGDCFLLGVSQERQTEDRIRMRRFLDSAFPSREKGEIRANRRIAEALMEEAEASLSMAGQIHGRLEAIYGACMDFERLERFSEKFCQSLF